MQDLSSCYQPDSDCADEIRKGNPPSCKICKRDVMLREQIAQVSHKYHGGDDNTPPCRVCNLIADDVVALVQQEIDKVRKQNPYVHEKGSLYRGYEAACDKLANLLKQIGG